MKRFIMQTRYNMYDLLEITINDISNCSLEIAHSSDYKQIWIYKDFHTEYYIVTFPIDLLYINALRGAKSFFNYIKHKLEILLKSLSQQSNNQS